MVDSDNLISANNLGQYVMEPDNKAYMGILAMLDHMETYYQPSPLLEILLDRFARLFTTSLRNFTLDNVTIDILHIRALRFEDYLHTIPFPSLLSVVTASGWEISGLIVPDSSFVCLLIDVLCGGRKAGRPTRMKEHAYTTIEHNITRQLVNLMLKDLSKAFVPLTPGIFFLERMETIPHLITIVPPEERVTVIELKVQLSDRCGTIAIMLREADLNKDVNWDSTLESEIHNTPISLEAVLSSKQAFLQDIMKLKVGNTLLLDHDVIMHSAGVKLLAGTLGNIGNHMAVSINTTAP